MPNEKEKKAKAFVDSINREFDQMIAGKKAEIDELEEKQR